MAFACEFSTEGMLAANTLSTQTQQKNFYFLQYHTQYQLRNTATCLSNQPAGCVQHQCVSIPLYQAENSDPQVG